MSSKQFTAQVFAWLQQINRDPHLLAIDVKVALELTRFFNEKDQGGRAFPSCKTLGDAIGMSERTIRRSVERMTKGGHVYTILGKPGRGHPNQYWMTLKTGTATPVLDAEKTGTGDRQKTGICDKKTGTATPENHLKNQEADRGCLRNPLSAGERVRASRDEKSPPSGAPPLTRDPAGLELDRETESAAAKKKIPTDENESAESAEDAAAALEPIWTDDQMLRNLRMQAHAFRLVEDVAGSVRIDSGDDDDPPKPMPEHVAAQIRRLMPQLSHEDQETLRRREILDKAKVLEWHFRKLRALWRRGHASDDTPKAIAIARNAFAKACSIADATTIMDGARAWVAAVDAPRYLPALAKWLAARGWEKPPPAKLHHDATSKRGGGRGGGRDRPPRKPDFAAIGAALAAEYEAHETGGAVS
jgi:hypothetical protein